MHDWGELLDPFVKCMIVEGFDENIAMSMTRFEEVSRQKYL